MLSIDLTGKRAFVAGVGDNRGYGWAIVRALMQAGAAVRVGTWPPMLNIFTKSMERGKFDLSLPGGGEIEFEKIHPMDATFDTPEDVPEEIREDKRYRNLSGYTIQEVADSLRAVRQGMDQDVQATLSELVLERVRNLLDRITRELPVSLVLSNFLRYVLRCIEGRVHRMDLLEFDFTSTGKAEIEFSARHALREDVEHGGPRAHAHRRAGLHERPHDGPAVSPVVPDARDERSLPSQVYGKHSVLSHYKAKVSRIR